MMTTLLVNKRVRSVRGFLLALILGSIPAGAADSTPLLEIQADQVAGQVSPMLYGLMTEEINYSYDGGLYAELVRNRIFKDSTNGPVHWTVVQQNGAVGSIELDASQPINEALTTCLRLDASAVPGNSTVGIANDGFWGNPVRPRTRYQASVYARAGEGFAGPLTVTLESADGATVYARAKVPRLTPDHIVRTNTSSRPGSGSLAGRISPTPGARSQNA